MNCVPSFAQGFEILLVHNDTLSLINLSSMLENYSFKVTVTDEAKAAMSMISKHEGYFKLVMAKANMPDMDTLSFLQFLHRKDIPVIFISSGEYNEVTWKALAKGSCYFLEEPILFQDLKYVWQHVYHRKLYSAKRTQKAKCLDKVHGIHDQRRCMQKDKRKKYQMNFDSNHLTAAMEEEEERRERSYYGYAEKKSRIVWTPELHQKFLDAIDALGNQNNIRPKAILEQMNVPELTARQVSSHLQKYKTQAQINQLVCNPPVSNFSNFDGRFQYYSPFQSQGYSGVGYPRSAYDKSGAEFGLGFPAPSSSLNESQNQMQFPAVVETSTSAYELPFPTAMANYGSQNLGAVVGQPMTDDASMHQNQPMMTAYDSTMQMLEEDCNQYESSPNGLLPNQVDEYTEMLRNILLGDSPNPQQTHF
ncbi:two-component response regulator ORR26-like [Senna tora]|uniref:Two-component response regulator ORR26-like n=1 Tax=Senna tora TaxID=362788 RepID=A0A834W9F4_9FABA|nr:two-component response regulator ORR26-like [Senna tora]